MKNAQSNYYKTPDGEQIFYSINFDPEIAPERVLVFNYGLVCSNHHWSKQIEAFDEMGYNILLHDYRGHYLSSGAEELGNITFESIASDLRSLLLSLNVKSSIQIGHSMGVNVCLEFARRYPEMTEKLALISGTVVPVFNVMFNTNLTDQLSPLFLNALKTFPETFKTVWKYGGWSSVVRKIIHIGGFNIKTVPDEFIEIYLNRLGQLGPELFFQLVQQMHQHDIMPYLERIETPTLVIGGDKDKVIPNYLQKLLVRELPNARLYIARNGSHVPQVDFPKHINERLQLFFESSR